MEAEVNYPLTAQKSEDRWVAQAIMNAGLVFHPDKSYRLLTAPPRIAKPFPADTIACCEYDPKEMRQLHKSERGVSAYSMTSHQHYGKIRSVAGIRYAVTANPSNRKKC